MKTGHSHNSAEVVRCVLRPRLINGRAVRIDFAERAGRKRDNFGRRLCKVYVGDLGVGAAMVRIGHARVR